MLYPNHEKHKGFRILFCNTKHQKTGSSGQDGGVGKKPFASSHNQKEDNNQSKFNKQPEVPENQTAWNSDNQGIKEKINQNNQTGKMVDCTGQGRKTALSRRPWGRGWLQHSDGLHRLRRLSGRG